MQKQRHGDPKAIPIRSEEQTGRRKSENDLICDELRTHPNLDLRFKTEARTGRKSRRTVQRICIWIVSIVTGVMVYERWGSEARYALRVWDSVGLVTTTIYHVGLVSQWSADTSQTALLFATSALNQWARSVDPQILQLYHCLWVFFTENGAVSGSK
nr:hypothetical protein Iba_chr03dCG3230 [Ipomoea batatas]